MFSRATRSSMSVTSMSSRSSTCASSPDASWPSAVMIASTRRWARDRSPTTSARSSAGRSWIRSVSRSARMAVSGVRSSWAALAAKSWAACSELVVARCAAASRFSMPDHRLGQLFGLAGAAHRRHLLGALAQLHGLLGQLAQRPDRRAGQQPAHPAGDQHRHHPDRGVERYPAPAQQNAVRPDADRYQHTALLVQRHRAHSVVDAVDFDGRGARRQRRQLEAALEHHLPGRAEPPRCQHAAAGIGQLIGIYACVDDGIEPTVQLGGVVVGQHHRGEDGERGDDGGGRRGGRQGHPGAQRCGSTEAWNLQRRHGSSRSTYPIPRTV